MTSESIANYRERVNLTTSCRDTDGLAKVDGAGETFGENDEFQRMHNGLVIRRGGYHGDWMTEIIRKLRGHHEPQEEKVFASVLDFMPDGAVMVELGAFWAYYSMWFQQKVRAGKSVLVEPVAEKMAVGQGNFKLNGMTGTFINAFVGDHSDPGATFVDWDGSRLKLPMVSVDDLMAEQQISRIHLLHSDIQGAESDMLRGADRALRLQNIDYLFISTHGCEHRPCLKLLKERGYRIVVEHSILESFSADGLIVARSEKTRGPDLEHISRRKAPLTEKVRHRLMCSRSFVRRKFAPFLKRA